MVRVRAVRESASCPNPFAMCTSPRLPSKSRSLCRYETASHLHIPLAFETTCLQAFAQNHCLTPSFCADPQGRERGQVARTLLSARPSRPSKEKTRERRTASNVFIRLRASMPICTRFHVSIFNNLQTQFRRSPVFPSVYAFPGEGGAGKSLAFILWKEIACESA